MKMKYERYLNNAIDIIVLVLVLAIIFFYGILLFWLMAGIY